MTYRHLTQEERYQIAALHGGEWAERAGEYVGSIKRFAELLVSRGFTHTRMHGGKRAFQGVALRPKPYTPHHTDATANRDGDGW